MVVRDCLQLGRSLADFARRLGGRPAQLLGLPQPFLHLGWLTKRRSTNKLICSSLTFDRRAAWLTTRSSVIVFVIGLARSDRHLKTVDVRGRLVRLAIDEAESAADRMLEQHDPL